MASQKPGVVSVPTSETIAGLDEVISCLALVLNKGPFVLELGNIELTHLDDQIHAAAWERILDEPDNPEVFWSGSVLGLRTLSAPR